MFTFSDVLHDAKQKNIYKLSRVRGTDWKLALTENNSDGKLFESSLIFSGLHASRRKVRYFKSVY